MEPADRAAGHVYARVRMPDVFAVVAGERVVRRVHADRQCVVVVGERRVLAQRLLQRLAGAAATGEQIDHDLTGAQARALR